MTASHPGKGAHSGALNSRLPSGALPWGEASFAQRFRGGREAAPWAALPERPRLWYSGRLEAAGSGPG
eukprot:15480456-Alexandrium_andersonii.AAC.1